MAINAPSQTLPDNFKAIWFQNSSQSDNIDGIPDLFMNEPNATIIQKVKALGCNTIFMNVALLPTNQTTNSDNLGLTTYPGYKDKFIDFVDLATTENIKVYGVPALDHNWILTPNHQLAVTKIGFLAYYQAHVRTQTAYAPKKCLLQGVVTNLEPWAISQWMEDALCTSSGRDNNNQILAQYLDLIPKLYEKLEIGRFFDPYILPGYTLQPRDNLFMGTVHWNWHYFSQIRKNGTDNFFNGNYALYVGIRNNKHYFDILLPETYCSKTSNTCMSSPCTDNTIHCLCDNANYYIGNEEKTGDCAGWFKKHFVDKDFYDSQSHPYVIRPIVMPVDAAPMLYGHSEYNFSNHCETWTTATSSLDFTKNCRGKNNYKGFFIWDYHEAIKTIPRNLNYCVAAIQCDEDPPQEGISPHKRNFNIYPNPADNVLTIEGLQEGDRVEIYDLNQTLRITTLSSAISLEGIEEGPYLVRIMSGQQRLLKTAWIVVKRD